MKANNKGRLTIAIACKAVDANIIKRCLLSTRVYDIVWSTKDGLEAVRRVLGAPPDLLLIDFDLESLPGIDVIKKVTEKTNCAVLVVTENPKKKTSKVFEAMGAGARDVVVLPGELKPSETRPALLQKVATIGTLLGVAAPNQKTTTSSSLSFNNSVECLLAIGASTGGPAALAGVLNVLPVDFPAAIVIIQHLDEQFSSGFCNWLKSQTKLPVRIAKENEPPAVGQVLLSGRSDHLVLKQNGILHYTAHPVDYPYRPSVNEFFESITEYWNGRCVGVLLTGMGKDGATGLLSLHNKGYHTIAQDAKSSVVYGMPKAAAELSAASEILALNDIGSRVIELV